MNLLTFQSLSATEIQNTHTQKNQKMLLCKPSLPTLPQLRTSNSTPRNPNKRSLSIITTNSTTPTQRRRTMSAFEARISLVFALASQASSLSQRRKCPTPIPFFTFFFFTISMLLLFESNFNVVFFSCSFSGYSYRGFQIRVPEEVRESNSRGGFNGR